jgi:secreted trypsin-like serine protease
MCCYFILCTLFFSFSNFSYAIINGVEVNEDDHPSVVCLYNEKTGEICTGTFVTPTLVLTAAHCIGGEQNKKGQVDVELSIVEFLDIKKGKYLVHGRSTRAFRHPYWIRRSGSNGWDLGLVEFKKGVSLGFSEISSQKIGAGDKVDLVGYGTDQMNALSILERAGVKRWGENRIAGLSKRGAYLYVDSSIMNANSEGRYALGNFGDSGGPVFVDGKVTAVWSRTTSDYEGIAIRLNSSSSQEFLKKFIHP